jgi:hypothetical protein
MGAGPRGHARVLLGTQRRRVYPVSEFVGAVLLGTQRRRVYPVSEFVLAQKKFTQLFSAAVEQRA